MPKTKTPAEILQNLGQLEQAILDIFVPNMTTNKWNQQRPETWSEWIMKTFGGVRGVVSGTDAQKKAKVLSMLQMLRDEGYAGRVTEIRDGVKVSALTDAILSGIADKLLDNAAPNAPSLVAKPEPPTPTRKNNLPLAAPPEIRDKIQKFLMKQDITAESAVDRTNDIVECLSKKGNGVHTKAKAGAKLLVLNQLTINDGKLSLDLFKNDHKAKTTLEQWMKDAELRSTTEFKLQLEGAFCSPPVTDSSKDLFEMVLNVVHAWKGADGAREKRLNDEVHITQLVSTNKPILKQVYYFEGQKVLDELQKLKRNAGVQALLQLSFWIAEVCFKSADWTSGINALMSFVSIVPLEDAPVQVLFLLTALELMHGDILTEERITALFERFNPNTCEAERDRLVEALQFLDDEGRSDDLRVAFMSATRGEKADERTLDRFFS